MASGRRVDLATTSSSLVTAPILEAPIHSAAISTASALAAASFNLSSSLAIRLLTKDLSP